MGRSWLTARAILRLLCAPSVVACASSTDGGGVQSDANSAEADQTNAVTQIADDRVPDGSGQSQLHCVAITGDDDWGSQQPLHNFWRDEVGLHWVAKRRQAPEQLLLETYEPTNGRLITSTGYDVLDVDPVGGTVSGVAHAPSGTVAVSYTLYEDGFEGHYLLLTTVTDPESYHVVQTPWDSVEISGRSLGWDGEAFVWHGLNLDGELVVARFDEEGSEVLPLQIVGFPTSRLWNGFDMRTDPSSGITWMVSPGGDAVRVTGTRRDGSPLTPNAEPVLVGSFGSSNPPDNAHVATNSEGELLFTFTMHLDGFVAQRTDNELDELGELVRVPIEEFASRDFQVSNNGAAYWRDDWWVLSENGLGIVAQRVDGDSVTDTFEVVHYPAREIFEETGDLPNQMRVDQFSAMTFEDELWFGFSDESATHAGGTGAFRVVRVDPACTYPSRYDELLAEEGPE